MKLSRKTLETTFEALQERSRKLGEISRTGLTVSIRKAAEEDYKKTNAAWKEVEQVLTTNTKKS